MFVNHLDQPRRPKSHTLSLVLLFLGMALALAGNAYQFVRGEHMNRDLATMQKSTQNQIAKLNSVSAAMLEENQQRFEAIKNQLQEFTAASLRQSRREPARTSSLQLKHPPNRYTLELSKVSVAGGRTSQ
jgi:uncharacterized protein HemX